MFNIKKILPLAVCALISLAIGVACGIYIQSHVEKNKGLVFLYESGLLIEEGKYEEALRYAYSGVSMQKDGYLSLDLIGDIHYCIGQKDAALTNYKLALNHNSESVEGNVKNQFLRKKIDSLSSMEGDFAIFDKMVKCKRSI